MKQFKKSIMAIAVIMLQLPFANRCLAQKWDLDKCILYARENNISIRSKEASKESADEDVLQAKAQMYPSLNFSSNQTVNFTNTSTYNEYNEASNNSTYNSSYNLSSSLTVFKGLTLNNTLKQKKLQSEASQYDIEQAMMDLEISVTKAYLQILYDKEALEINKKGEELSLYQVQRGESMYQAGSISKGDLAQLQSQNASDKYNVVTAERSLSVAQLELKQLLELGIDDSIDIVFPEINDEGVLTQITPIAEIYANALEGLPQMKSSSKSLEAAQKAIDIATGSYYPSLSLSAGISTGAVSTSKEGYMKQLDNKMGENVGLNLQIPIYSNRQIKTSVNKAKIQKVTTELQDETNRKNLLSTLESLYNEATNAQSQYISALEQLAASEISYQIINEQFSSGLKNTVDLITEQNTYINAMSQKIQAKYRTLLAIKILYLYKNC